MTATAYLHYVDLCSIFTLRAAILGSLGHIASTTLTRALVGFRVVGHLNHLTQQLHKPGPETSFDSRVWMVKVGIIGAL